MCLSLEDFKLLIIDPHGISFRGSLWFEFLIFIYRMRAINPHGLYIFNPLFEGQKHFFKEVFQKILPLCTVSIQERFVIKCGL